MTRIFVTRRDINEGTQYDCEDCPVSRALKRVVKHGIKVEVTQAGIVLNGVDINTPAKVGYFAGQFDGADNQMSLDPFKFDLNIPRRFL